MQRLHLRFAASSFQSEPCLSFCGLTENQFFSIVPDNTNLGPSPSRMNQNSEAEKQKKLVTVCPHNPDKLINDIIVARSPSAPRQLPSEPVQEAIMAIQLPRDGPQETSTPSK